MTALSKRAEKRRKEIEDDLNAMIEDTIKESWSVNSLAWAAVVGGAFALNLLLLVVITGAPPRHEGPD